ncbi:hypothetical protein NEMIN01_0226 [Nematocida minor]|uniref:uncharacterized protein n=1 Tax=Nematocida minor TaxID=1912983 RepID=UPI00221F0C9F|nr:uncharacterized protein NEMIN01_0226 [Nematocida minor]KAI5188962.1 hypothetical protein NEMIN01_0226 [Nematocida minor]
MENSSFVEFLSCIKENEKKIALLSNEAQAVEEMKKRYVSSNLTQSSGKHILESFKARTNSFYSRSKEIKENIEEIRKAYSRNGVLEKKMHMHILALYSRLKAQTEGFVEAKAGLLQVMEKKQDSLSAFAPKKQTRKEDSGEGGGYSLEGECFDEPKADQSIQELLLTLEELNTTFIELNEIIGSSSVEIEGASSKMFLNRNLSVGVNTQIETATVRRKRRRWLKSAGLLLVIAVCSIIFIYFGRGMLDFIIKLKDAIK